MLSNILFHAVLTFTVQSLTKTLDCCVPVWEHFALGLGVQSKFTDKLKCEPKDINLYFTKMLRYWVEHGSKNLDHLVEALKFLSKKNLANKIEKAYKGTMSCIIIIVTIILFGLEHRDNITSAVV